MEIFWHILQKLRAHVYIFNDNIYFNNVARVSVSVK